MDWGKLGFLFVITFIGYLPYKTMLKLRIDGLATISFRLSLLMSIWFFVLSMILILRTTNLLVNMSVTLTIVIGFTISLWFVAPWILQRIGRYPAEIIGNKPKWYLLRAQHKTFILKFYEILFQQAKFAYLLFEVLGGMPSISRIWWFTGIVGFLHIFNIFFVPSGWLFFIMSIPMGPLFSWLILNGYIAISTAIHLWFYLLLVSWYWLRR